MAYEQERPADDYAPAGAAGAPDEPTPDELPEVQGQPPAPPPARRASQQAVDGAMSNTRRPRKARKARQFPASSFIEALPLAEAIHRFGGGQRVRRLTLFENLERSPDSGPSRQLITNSAQYGLTRGSYSAEHLELTDEGKLASGDESLGKRRLAAQLELAIRKIEPFNALYERFQDNRLPAPNVLRDFVVEQTGSPETADECVQTFLANARDLGLLRTYAGAERILTFEHLLEEEDGSGDNTDIGVDEDSASEARSSGPGRSSAEAFSPLAKVVAEASNLSDVCFLVSPIGLDGSEHRKHADLIFGTLIEPALVGLGLRAVRADRISKPGVITAQVIEHIVMAPLLIADLSYGNPNVFYELALRHACRRPCVQIIRSCDSLPFDVGQFRTVVLDMTDIYTFVPRLESYRAELARQCRSATSEEGPFDSPLSFFYPKFWEQFGHDGN